MKILLVDDEAVARQRLCDLLTDLGYDGPFPEAANGREAIDLTASYRPDVVLLDIRMPGIGGLETALHLSTLPYPPAVIFVTAYDQHAVDAFEANAVDYLLKPVRSGRLKQALDKAQLLSPARIRQLGSSADTGTTRSHISVSTHGTIRLVPIGEIVCMKADQKYVTLSCPDREYLIEETLRNLEEEFAGQFIRIHRNALVRADRLVALEKNPEGSYQVRLSGLTSPLAVSRRHLAAIKSHFRQAGMESRD